MSSVATPAANTSAPTTTTTTTTATLPTQPPPQPPLPQPQLFDILPPLHALLTRLEPSLNTYTPDTTTSATGTSTSGPTAGANNSVLEYKDVVTAAQSLKSRIRKALAELGALSDMERSVGEQEEEIQRLEERIRGQVGVLERLGEVAEREGRGVVGMGMEG